MSFLRTPVIIRNLLVMGAIWCMTWFNFYIFKFQLKYLPGIIFHNFMADAVAQIIAIILAGILYTKLSLKMTFTILYSVSIVGGFLVLFLGHDYPGWMPVFVGVSKFGVAGGFLLLLTSTLDMFPIAFAVQALSFMNFFGRLFTGIGPQVSERPEPLPMIVFLTLGITSMITI
jgi:hypothetical protein